MDLPRDRAIDVEARRYEDQLRTLSHGRDRRHGRANAEGARLVARGGHHAPLGPMADGDRSAAKLGVVALFDRRIEGIHVDVDNLAQRHLSAITGLEQKREPGTIISAQAQAPTPPAISGRNHLEGLVRVTVGSW